MEDYFQSQKNIKHLNINTKYFESITLKEFILKEQKKIRLFIKEDIIWKILIQLCLALYDIHSKNIIHRNIKSSSILLDSKYNIKLTNFKNCFLLKFENDLCKEDFPPNEYTSPEIIIKERYNTKSDVWPLGVLLYEICTFNKPFKGENNEGLYKNIIKGKYEKIGNKYTKELIEIIYQMLKVKYQERISIKEIINKSIFISMSKKLNLDYYVEKIINSNNFEIKEKIIKKNFFINRDYDKKLKMYKNNLNKKQEKEKIQNYIEKLAEEYFDIKKNVEAILGAQKAEQIFKEFSKNNIDDIINKFTYEYNNSEIKEKLKILLIDYIHISINFSRIKNKI